MIFPCWPTETTVYKFNLNMTTERRKMALSQT